MEFNLEEAYKLYVNLDNITKAAQQHCADLGISYSEKYRHRLSRAINSGSFQESNQEEYVEDVYDNGTIFISQYNFNFDGRYSEMVMSTNYNNMRFVRFPF